MKVLSTNNQRQRRAEVYSVHRNFNREVVDKWLATHDESIWKDVGLAREILWHSLSFFEGDEKDICRANGLVARVPCLQNHFLPISAVQIFLRYDEKLTQTARANLVKIINASIAEAIDFGFAASGVNNMSAMRAFMFLGASQVIETYEAGYECRSIPEVYNRFRLRQFGLNTLQLMDAQLRRTEISQEFNSPDYSAITLWAITEILNLIDYEPALTLARQIEGRLWSELFSFYHPGLSSQCGPYSRGYAVDTVGHATSMRVVWSFLGLDKTSSIEDLLYPPQEGQVVHHMGDVQHQQSMVSWLISTDYNVPEKGVAELARRSFPYEIRKTFEQQGHGFLRSDGKVFLNVEGDYMTPGGRGEAVCYQDKDFSIGSMSECYGLQNHPCHIIYKLHGQAERLDSTRAATVFMCSRNHFKTITDAFVSKTPDHMVRNIGRFLLGQNGSEVKGTVQPFHWAKHFMSGENDELCLVLLFSEHLPLGYKVQNVSLNEKMYHTGESLEIDGTEGIFEVADGNIQLRLKVGCETGMSFVVERYEAILACMAVFKNNISHELSANDLKKLSANIKINIDRK